MASRIRQILLDRGTTDLAPRAEMLLYMASRASWSSRSSALPSVRPYGRLRPLHPGQPRLSGVRTGPADGRDLARRRGGHGRPPAPPDAPARHPARGRPGLASAPLATGWKTSPTPSARRSARGSWRWRRSSRTPVIVVDGSAEEDDRRGHAPQTRWRVPWGSVRGHDRVVESLRRALSRGRLPHAFLFVGPEGIGKRLFANRLAQSLLCERRPEAELDPCGVCPGCLQVEGRTHPDVLRVAKPEDKSGVAHPGDPRPLPRPRPEADGGPAPRRDRR